MERGPLVTRHTLVVMMVDGRVVIGANGYIGRHVCREFERSNLHFAMTSRGDGAALATMFPSRRLIDQFSLFDSDARERLHGFSTFIILASASVPSTFAQSPASEIEHNLLPLARLFEAIPLGARVIFLSSGGTVYGDAHSEDRSIGEASSLRPISPYGLGKAMIEQVLRFAARSRGFDFVILRPSNPSGPSLRTERESVAIKAQGAITVFLQRVMDGEPIRIFGDGLTERDYFDVRDLARAVVMADTHNGIRGATFNIGRGAGVALSSLVDVIREVTGLRIEIDWQPERPFDVRRVVLDCSSAEQQFGWTPKIPLRQTIADTFRDLQKATGHRPTA